MDIENHHKETNVTITFSATEKELRDLHKVICRGVKNTPIYRCFLDEIYASNDMLTIVERAVE